MGYDVGLKALRCVSCGCERGMAGIYQSHMTPCYPKAAPVNLIESPWPYGTLITLGTVYMFNEIEIHSMAKNQRVKCHISKTPMDSGYRKSITFSSTAILVIGGDPGIMASEAS
jgi:hypothetical protein